MNTDVISLLTAKRRNLAEQKSQVLKEAEREIAHIDAELADVNKAISMLNDAIKEHICPSCRGTGNVRQTDAAGGLEDVTCPVCNGTGVRFR